MIGTVSAPYLGQWEDQCTPGAVSDQVIENLLSYYVDHFEALSGRDAVNQEVAMDDDELVQSQR